MSVTQSVAKISLPGPRPENEDAASNWLISGIGIGAAIADGLGGMGGGQLAAKMAVEKFESFTSELESFPEDLSGLAMRIHEAIRDAQRQSQSFSSMATTLSAAVISSDRLEGVHCGDSRISVARKNGIKRLTRDQTEGQRLFDSGRITKSELFDYPRKNILDSALGIHGIPRIERVKFDVQSGDKIFFSTDGLHNVIQLRELWALAIKSVNANELISRVEKIMSERATEDNYSLIAIYLA